MSPDRGHAVTVEPIDLRDRIQRVQAGPRAVRHPDRGTYRDELDEARWVA